MRSLALKLTIAFVFVGVAGVLLVALLVGRSTQREFNTFLLERYRTELVDELLDYYRRRGSWQGVDERLRAPRGAFGLPLPVTLLDAQRRVVYSRIHPPGRELSSQEAGQGLILAADGTPVGWLLVDTRLLRRIVDNSPEALFLDRMRRALLWGVVGAAVLALFLGMWLARTLTRPLRELTTATHALAHGALGEQVAVRSRDELGRLGEAFNQMSHDLARSTQLRRQMTADIAHELRTPLSVILGYSEALSDGKLEGSPELYAIVHDEARQLSRLVDDLRTLSLADAGELPLQRTPLPPGELLARAALAHQGQAAEHGIDLVVETRPDLPWVDVDPARMAQVLGNLLQNALHYTPRGGRVRLAATAGEGGVTLRVEDTGPGIAPEDLPLVFERFYRADKARHHNGGSGLGLAIAKSLVDMQGGTLAVHSTLGAGTTFTVTLPAVGRSWAPTGTG